MTDLFDRAYSESKKRQGMESAALNRPYLLAVARTVAREIALSRPTREVHADDVNYELMTRGIDFQSLGPAAGSIFKTREWDFTGHRIKSKRASNHARELKVWRLNDS